MNPTQLHDRFNLIVIGITALALAALLPVMGAHALGCLGLLGFLGFGSLFYRAKCTRILLDERDLAILRQANMVAQAALWGLSMPLMVCLPMLGRESGMLRVSTVQVGFWLLFMLVIAVQSLATLVLYRRS